MTLKKINPKAILYHYFEFVDVKGRIQYALYDMDMDMPIAYGGRSLVNGTIRNLPKYITIVYYKLDIDKETFYNPRNQKYNGKKKTAI